MTNNISQFICGLDCQKVRTQKMDLAASIQDVIEEGLKIAKNISIETGEKIFVWAVSH